MKRVICFPPGTAYNIGMFDKYLKYPWTAPILEILDDVVGRNLTNLIADGPLEDWWEVEYSFPAIAADAILSIETAKNLYGFELSSFSYGIGISTGEFIGAGILGGLSYEEVIKLVKLKGELNADAPD